MSKKSGSGKRSDSTSSGGVSDKDMLTADLKDRIAVLESELRLKKEDAYVARDMQHLVMDNIPQGVFWKDLDSIYLGCNNVFAKSVGLASSGDIVGKTDYDLPWSPEQAESFREYDRRIMDNDAPECHIIEQQREADGRLVWVETKKVPLHDARGKVIGILGTYENVTERKRAKDALLESENKFRVLAETSPAAIFLYQGEKYIYVNPMAEALTGYSREELLAGNSWEWIHPEYRELVRERARKRQLGKRLPNRYEVKYRARDGREGWVDFIAGMVEYDGKPAGLAMAFDVSKRKRAEKDLMLTQFSIDRAADIALWVGPDGRFIYANEAASRAFGYTRKEFLTLSAFDTNPYFNEENWGEHWKEVKERGSYTFEARLRKKDGTFFPGEITVNYLVYDGMEYNCSYVRDITERKRAEEAIKAAKDQAELYVDLMGHDINNIHQAALGYLELARDMPGDARDEYLNKATEALQRSTLLISNVRKLQKYNDGIHAHDVDVCGVLTGVYVEYAITPGKTVTLNLNGFEHCHVRADDLLHDVFSNLVGNAVKHTDGNAHVSIILDKVKGDDMEYCRVLVEDNGPGITDETKKRLFNRSLKGTPRAKGMGLGLYIVKTLIDSYGGRVWVEDRVPGDHSKGARFVVVLPAVDK